EPEELDTVEAHGPRQYAAEDFDRLLGRTEQISALEAAHGQKEDLTRVQHPDRPRHGSRPPRGRTAQHDRGQLNREGVGAPATRVTRCLAPRVMARMRKGGPKTPALGLQDARA